MTRIACAYIIDNKSVSKIHEKMNPLARLLHYLAVGQNKWPRWEGRKAMSRYLKLSIIALLALVCIVPVASARPRVFVGGYFGPAYYGPAWYGPGWGWYGAPYGYGYATAPTTGSVKFETKMKEAAVYVDGGYAGTV